jgi:Tfp pilus assembly protein PilF
LAYFFPIVFGMFKVSYLDKALEIDPKHIDALVFKSQALSNMGNYARAKYYFDKVLR